MLTNKEIAKSFQLLGNLMELHNENPFKVRSYQNAYIALRKIDLQLTEMSDEELTAIKGVGKSIVHGIRELQAKGKLEALESLLEKTPPGVRDLLSIKGLGPKKIQHLWKDLDISSPGELLYACEENRLVEFKGFGYKTQEELRKKVRYFLDSRDKLLYQQAEEIANEILEIIRTGLGANSIEATGELRRCCPVVNTMEFITDASENEITGIQSEDLTLSKQNGEFNGIFHDNIEFILIPVSGKNFGKSILERTGSAEFLSALDMDKIGEESFETEGEVFRSLGLPPIPPEMRENGDFFTKAATYPFDDLITEEAIKGVLHNHCTYSDGLHTLREMAEYVKSRGFAYFGICDHSRSAFYANGLEPERVLQQFGEIEKLNAELLPFRIFKGIESDILSDGSLDYDEDLLKQFDFIVASIHSNLRMDIDKATDRLIKAVENPYTRILGHPTSRLLLAREGYPIDHKKVIDACAANGVVVELNANPMRLDIDYRWIPYAMEKDVMIAINPDAHSKEGIHHIRYGVLAARKGGLTTRYCLNCLPLEDFDDWIQEKP